MRAKIRAAAALLPPKCQAVQFDALGRILAPFTLEPSQMLKAPLYVLSVRDDGTCWALTTDGQTLAQARQSISWQKQGFEGRYVVCAYDRERGAFIGHDGATFTPDAGPYTIEAWERIKAEIAERAQ